MNKVSKIWWLHPVWIYFLWTLFCVYCSTIDSKSFDAMYKEPIYVNGFDILLYIIFFIIFTLGFFSYRTGRTRYLTVYDYSPQKIIKIFSVLYIWVVCAYIIWFANLYITYGSSIIIGLLGNLAGYADMFKDDGGKISGITTFTELAIIVAPLNTYLWYITKNKIYIKLYVFLLFICTLRATIFSERLAVMEIVVPSFVIYAYYGKFFKKKLYVQLAPILGIIIVLLVFGLFEYFRSWEFYKISYDNNFLSFIIDRVFGYYSLAINTECIRINFLGPKYFFDETLSWFWSLPGLSIIKGTLFKDPNIDILSRWGNPEFNNPGGLLFAYRDMGVCGGIIQFIFGRLNGRFYRGYCHNGLIGSLWYSASYLCMLELPRYFFWGSPRAFFAIIAMLIISKYIKKSKNRNEVHIHTADAS